MNPKKKIDEENLTFFAKMNATSFAAFTMAIFLVCFVFFYSMGVNSGMDIAEDNMARDNLAGQAHSNPLAECVLYSDEVFISEDNCTTNVECAPNGICLEEFEKCAYFVN